MSKSEHPDSWGISTGKPVPVEPKPEPSGPVNYHPGPDLDIPVNEAEAS